MKIIKGIGIVIILILAIIFVTPAFLSSSFKVERSATIKAAPETVFAEVNSFKKWESWSPWIKSDSTIKNEYSGPDAGVGAMVKWTSKGSGDGSMEIIESTAPAHIRTRLSLNEFTPFEGHFTFEATTDGTKTTWMDSGSVGYIGRWMTVMADKMMGPDFEKGLANLKTHVEGPPAAIVAAPDTTIATPEIK